MLTKRHSLLCGPNRVSRRDPSPCLIEANRSFLLLFLRVSSHLHLPPMNFITGFSNRFLTEVVSGFPAEEEGCPTIAAMPSGLQWTEKVSILKARLWKSHFTLWVANETATFVPNWDWYCTPKSDMKQLRLTLRLPLTKGFPPQFLEICVE